MAQSLVQNIDDILSIVDRFQRLPVISTQYERFENLDMAIYLQVHQLNLPMPDTWPVGTTNCPCIRTANGEIRFRNTEELRQWKRALRALQKLASAAIWPTHELTEKEQDTGSAPSASVNQIFLCCSPANFQQAAELRQALTDAGEQVWWDRDILAGKDRKVASRQAMQESCAVVLCFSRETQAEAKSELYSAAADAVALYRQYAPGSIFLIPVRLSDCVIPSIQIDANRWLDGIQHVDLFPPSKWAEGLEQLLKALRAATARTPPTDVSAATGFALLDDLVAAIDADEFSGSHLAPLLRDACRRPAEMATSADYSFDAIRQTIDIENERLAKIGEGAGKPDWQQDYAWVATNVSVALARAVRRSAAAQDYVVRVAKGVFMVNDFELMLDLTRENEFFDMACRAANGKLLPEEVFEILKTAEVRRANQA